MIYSGSSRSSSNLLQPYYTPARSQSSQGYSSDYRFPLPDQQQEVLPTTLMSSLNNLVNEISERLDNTTLLECKREKRSCSISSFLLNPNSLASTNTSPTPSPRSVYVLGDCSGQSSVGSTFFSPGHGLSPAPSPCSTPRPTRSSLSSPCGPKGRQRRVRSIAGSERKLSDQNTDTDDILYSLGFNPKLYQKNPEEQEEKFPENHLGRIFYNLSYEVDKETLSVRIINIKNLPNNPKEFGKIYKSYLAVCLLPDERSERKVYQAVDNF
ncbi:uncharacterized protein LOC111716722, partial [Eurytemora carolleeae]|uniref:uncharacterized protein LOC111716722 n=1 Tax=Eurytemora carolleeae TaxID=1294199 RepID=UPI000C76D7BB